MGVGSAWVIEQKLCPMITTLALSLLLFEKVLHMVTTALGEFASGYNNLIHHVCADTRFQVSSHRSEVSL